MQLEEMKVEPDKAKKYHENTADPVFLTYTWTLVLHCTFLHVIYIHTH